MRFKMSHHHLLTLLALSAGIFSQAASAELQSNTLSIDDLQRQYLISTPKNVEAISRPILVLLHGYGGSASQLIGLDGRAAPFRAWLQIAKRNNAVLIVPNGMIGSDGKRGWNDLRGVATNPNTDDLTFIRRLVQDAVSEHEGDTNRVYVVGISNGGHMAMRIALEAPKLVAGVGVVAAAMPANYKGPLPAKPLTIVFMNGTRDRLMPYAGGDMAKGRGTVLSSQDSFSYWADANQCSDKVEIKHYDNPSRKDRSRVIRSQFKDCAAGTQVALFKVRGGGHSTPSISERYRPGYLLLTGRQNWDIESAEEIWVVFDSATPTKIVTQ